MSRGRLRQPRPLALIAGALLALGVILVWVAVLAASPILGALAVTAFALAGIAGIQLLLAVRHHLVRRIDQIRPQVRDDLAPLARTDDIRALQRHTDELRAKQSRHEYHQEQALQRIEETQKLVAARHRQAPRPNSGRPRILFVSSNGGGLGHLTRLMAIAEQLDADTHFLSMSTGYELVRHRGHTIHHFPSADTSGLATGVWNRMFTGFLNDFVDEHRPDLVVFDGTWVYEGVTQVCRRAAIGLVWVQRGCWWPETDAASPQRHQAATACEAVIIPGDYGCVEEVDVGPHVPVRQVAPITLIGRDDVLDAAAARAELGLNPGRRHVLIQLGAGNINDTTSAREEAIRAVQALGPQWHPVLVQSPIALDRSEVPGVLTVTSYPVSRQFAAFDFVVVAAGYNTVQECVGLGLPAVFVPNHHTLTDDQSRRAHAVADEGWAEVADDPAEIGPAVERLVGRLDQVRHELAEVPPPDGAVAAAAALIEWLAQFQQLGAASAVGPEQAAQR